MMTRGREATSRSWALPALVISGILCLVLIGLVYTKYSDYNELEGKYRAQSQELVSAQTELSSAEAELVSTAAALATTEALLSSTQTQLSNTKTTLASTETKLSSTKVELTSTRTQLGSTQATLTSTKAELYATQGALADTQATLANVATELTSTQVTLSNAQVELSSTQATLANTQAELSTSQGALADTQAVLTNTQAELSISQQQVAALQHTVDLYNELGITVYEGIHPRPTVIQYHLVNNPAATNPTWQQLESFLLADPTDDRLYVDDVYMCGRFAEDVHNNAEAAGIRAAWVFVDWEASLTAPHALNVFVTSDQGPIYIDCTGVSYPTNAELDTIAHVEIGEPITWIGIGSPSLDWIPSPIVTEIQVYW